MVVQLVLGGVASVSGCLRPPPLHLCLPDCPHCTDNVALLVVVVLTLRNLVALGFACPSYRPRLDPPDPRPPLDKLGGRRPQTQPEEPRGPKAVRRRLLSLFASRGGVKCEPCVAVLPAPLSPPRHPPIARPKPVR